MKQIFRKRSFLQEEEDPIFSSPGMPEEERDFTSALARERLKTICVADGRRAGGGHQIIDDDPVAFRGVAGAKAFNAETDEPAQDEETYQPLASERRLEGPRDVVHDAASRDTQTVEPVVSKEDQASALQEQEGSAAAEEGRLEGSREQKASRCGASPKPLIDRRFPDPDAVLKAKVQKEERARKTVSFVDAIIEDRRKQSAPAKVVSKETNSMADTQKDSVTRLLKSVNNAENLTTVVSEGTKQTGDTDAKERNMVILGSYEGNLRCKMLVIGECGSVKGNVDAEVIEIMGALSGEVSANDISLRSTGAFEGEFVCLNFAMEYGSRFNAKGQALPEEQLHEDSTGSDQRRFPRVAMSGATARSLRRQMMEDVA